MIVVADTSPLNYLIRSNYIWILRELFGEVSVPQAVLTELLHPNAPAEVRSFTESPPVWFKCVEVSDEVPGLPPSLGAGEREAISLALKIHADVLLIDDLAARKEALARSIPARGTLAVLLQASLRGHLDFRSAYSKLEQMGFRTSQSLKESLFDEYESSQNG